MKSAFRPLIIALLAFPVVLQAADDADSAASVDPVLQQAREAASRQDYAAAARDPERLRRDFGCENGARCGRWT